MSLIINDNPQPLEERIDVDPHIDTVIEPCKQCGKSNYKFQQMLKKSKPVIRGRNNIFVNLEKKGLPPAYITFAVVACADCGAISHYLPGSEKQVMPIEELEKLSRIDMN